jgi:hypothetical protein
MVSLGFYVGPIFQRRGSKPKFPSMIVRCAIDGVGITCVQVTERQLEEPSLELPIAFDGQHVTSTERRLFRFAGPVSSFLPGVMKFLDNSSSRW